jgi:hypothetical protein
MGVRLPVLWLIVMFNIVYRDIPPFMVPEFPEGVLGGKL